MSIFIIAEAGVNHNGSLETAKKMVDKAREAGADCIKFQTFVSGNIVSKHADKAEYQKLRSDVAESQLDMLRRLELSFNDFLELSRYCKSKGIKFLSTAFDLDSVDFLKTLGMGIWKIPSGEITNLPYLIRIAQTGQPLILSTGMCSLDEIHTAVEALQSNGSGLITLLQCTTEYPAPYSDVNLNAMGTMRERFGLSVGYSDHTQGIEISIAAAAVGATVIEKHFTLDRNMEGPDHKASLEPDELASMVRAIRHVELAMGSGEKKPGESEMRNIPVARKSIVARCRIKEGEVFSQDNITSKRPGNGISPMRWFEVLGQKAARDFEEDELITL